MSYASRAMPIREVSRTGLAALFALALAACATPPEQGSTDRDVFDEANDPVEPVNRYVHDVNVALDDLVLNPIATVYKEGVPEPYRNGVRNFLNNLNMPMTILNSALQGDWGNTIDASVSFFINTTAGLGGIFDIPGNFDEEPRREDFGQTLAVWGAGEGAYLVLPVFGPSNVRDTAGLAVDVLTDPLTYLLAPGWSYARGGSEVVQVRSDVDDRYDELRATSIDFYATLRSLYRQRRQNQISNGEGDMPDLDAFSELEGDMAIEAAQSVE